MLWEHRVVPGMLGEHRYMLGEHRDMLGEHRLGFSCGGSCLAVRKIANARS